jgi:hypothetical protein
MQIALKIARPESGELRIDPYTHGPSEDVTFTAPGIGQFSDWKTWPPALAMVDQVTPFLVKPLRVSFGLFNESSIARSEVCIFT